VESKPLQRRAQRETATDRLVRAYRERGDIRARDRVVQIHLPLVDTFARRYERAGASYDDLMRAGSIGLVDAIQRYVPRRGEEFIGFAVPKIVEQIKVLAGIDGAGGAARERSDNGVPEFDLNDERLKLASAYRALGPAEHEIIRMRFVDDLSSGQAAGRLGMSEEELARHTRAALARLRRKLERPSSGQPPVARPLLEEDAAEAPLEQPAEEARESHSGRLLLRMPPSLHTELASAAEREAVSLNHFITHTLSTTVGAQEGGTEDGAHLPPAQAPRWLRAALVVNIAVLTIAGILAIVLLLVAWQGA
jgi:RNA polymerase sigma factor (sigma-70 family)